MKLLDLLNDFDHHFIVLAEILTLALDSMTAVLLTKDLRISLVCKCCLPVCRSGNISTFGSKYAAVTLPV